ncbi:putative Nudix hydrolase NudL [Mycena kentingensis (nom. inval.)]|nr:putative Nudix hydrolase NudL [Mycena kentingensis (nom. inval.)]
MRPLTPRSLSAIRTALASASKLPSLSSVDKRQTAAILVPLCNVRDTPGILLQVRSRALRSHSGEISCPGGKVDELDASLWDTAVRETTEELGIPRNRIEHLGAFGPPEQSLRGDIVWPFVGFVHAENCPASDDDDAPLASINLSNLSSSPDEVAFVFHLPLAELVNPDRLRPYLFRNHRPYSAIDVSDLLPKNSGVSSVSIEKSQMNKVGQSRNGRTAEVWGLTGWYMSLLSSSLAPVLCK